MVKVMQKTERLAIIQPFQTMGCEKCFIRTSSLQNFRKIDRVFICGFVLPFEFKNKSLHKSLYLVLNDFLFLFKMILILYNFSPIICH